MKKIICLFVSVILISGCTTTSGVVPTGKDTFMVSRQAGSGFAGMGNLKADAFREANEFCVKQGKCLQVVSTSESQPPYILANFPRAEVQFMCLDANDPQLQRTRLEKSPDVVIKRNDTVKADIRTKEESNKNSELYTELTKLEDLREKKIITEEEFQTQKKLLLEKQK